MASRIVSSPMKYSPMTPPGLREQTAAIVLVNFSEHDAAWHDLMSSMIDPEDRVKGAAGAALRGLLGAERDHPVRWDAAREPLTAVLDGTNPFAFPTVLRVLAATEIEPAFGRQLIRGAPDLLLAYAGAEHEVTRESAIDFLKTVSGEDFGANPEAWSDWLTGSPGRFLRAGTNASAINNSARNHAPHDRRDSPAACPRCHPGLPCRRTRPGDAADRGGCRTSIPWWRSWWRSDRPTQPRMRSACGHYLEGHPAFYGSAAALMDEAGTVTASPYVYRTADGYHIRDLALPEYNIEAQEWITMPLAANASIWTPPYFDAGGGEIWMTTHSVPARDAGGIFAIVTTDLPVDAPGQ